ncbi:helix-turn-helix transcriptional regulator [Vagococcus sp. BWB3-3]|uniref:Helix-turn-helix transcriptional regulator n=1 Tax=Vagococcus allomyrinae TaxID=2794353 RepID=A0A940SRU5_9ENTE|nr:helix-turn-helix transcriptional regulator [Vagococcus allomyrinae]MBP1041217.1 helix-turn-helix transcriptional regulator [Vagococcus allomyrinae]
MVIAYNIRKYREEKNITQQNLADYLHISRQSISKWERGDSLPSIDNLILLSEYLQIPLDTLVKEQFFLPLPFEFDKPKSFAQLRWLLFFPGILLMMMFFPSDLMDKLTLIPIALFILILELVMTFFDFKRYYAYFTVEKDGLRVFHGNTRARTVLPNLYYLLLIAIGKRQTVFVPYSEIETITIFFETRGYNSPNTVVVYRPRQAFALRERFEAHIRLKDEEQINLNLDGCFYAHSLERKYFYAMFAYFQHKEVKVKDPYHILSSLEQEHNFIQEAYQVGQQAREKAAE